MKNCYEEKYLPAIEGCGKNGRLNFLGAAVAFMNSAKIHEDILGCNIYQMRERHMHWVMAKSHIRLVKPLKLLTNTVLRTWGFDCFKSRFERGYCIGELDDPYAIGRTQWALLDDSMNLMEAAPVISNSHPLEKVNLFNDPWPVVDRDFSQGEEIGRYTVKSTDIDFVGHMNNVAYIRGLLACHTSDELLEMSELYIQFVHSCMEGEELVYYKKNGPEGYTDYCAMVGNTPAIYARIK